MIIGVYGLTLLPHTHKHQAQDSRGMENDNKAVFRQQMQLPNLSKWNQCADKKRRRDIWQKKSLTYFGLCTFLVDELVMQTHISSIYFAIVKTKNETNARSYFKLVQKNHIGQPSPMQASF